MIPLERKASVKINPKDKSEIIGNLEIYDTHLNKCNDYTAEAVVW